MRTFAVAFRQLGIRSRLLALWLTVAVPFAAYVIADGIAAAHHAAAEATARNGALVRGLAVRLDDHISDIDQLLATVSHVVNPSVDAVDQNHRLLQALRAGVLPFVRNIVVFDLSGNSTGATDPALRAPALNVRDRHYFQQALSMRALTVDAPITARPSHERVAIFARPIERDGAVAGAIAASISLEHLDRLLDANGSLPAGATVLVTTRDGIVLNRRGRPADAGESDLSRFEGIADAAEQREGAFDATAADGVPRTFGFATARQAPWIVLVGVEPTAATAPVWAQLRRSMTIGAAIMLAALLLATLIARQITRPLARLTDDARRLAHGELAHRSAIRGDDEIGVLGETLNYMATQVEQRTAALARSERRLGLIAENLPALVTYINADATYRFANAQARRFFGRPNNLVVGHSVREVRGDAAWRELEPRLHEALAGHTVHFMQGYETPDGHRDLAITYLPDRGVGDAVRGIYVLGIDLTDRLRAEEALRASEAKLRAIADNLPVLIGIVDRELAYRFCNETYRAWLGTDPAGLVGRSVESVLGAEGFAADLPWMRRALDGETVSFERSGKFGADERHMLKSYIPLRAGTDGAVEGFYVLVQDLTERRRLEAQLERMAQFDQLTGLPNRYLLEDRLAQACHRSRRDAIQLALLYLDLDGFKPINDRYGHAAGDHLLRTLADRLTSAVRASDTVARVGGDEFVLVLDGFVSYSHLDLFSRKIIERVRAPIEWQGAQLACSVSIGVATFPPARSWQSLMEIADRAMYQAKASGPGSFVIAPVKHAIAAASKLPRSATSEPHEEDDAPSQLQRVSSANVHRADASFAMLDARASRGVPP